MAIISTQTTVTIGDATAIVTTSDLVLQPTIVGTLAARGLTHPQGTLGPLIYTKNPDEWTNFDVSPMVKRPSVASLRTLTDTRLTAWGGFDRDASVTEIWRGSETEASMEIDFFRQLYAYFENPPTVGFIQWSPADRTVNVYNILIERLTAGGSEIKMNFIALRQNYILGDIVFKFRIVSQV